MSFYTSLSGLQASQTELSTISHNIANAATNGFKKSMTDFADVMASSVTTDPRAQVGSGVAVKENRQKFTEGNLNKTGNALDLAVSGDGFFAVKTADSRGTIAYTRNGAFSVDSNRYIIDAQGSRLQAYPVETDGTVVSPPTPADLRIPLSSGQAAATANFELSANLNGKATAPTATFSPTDPSSYTHATSTTIYDAGGNPSTLTTYFVRNPSASATDTGSHWTMYNYAGGQPVNGGAGTTLTFDSSGNRTAPVGNTNLTLPADASGAQRTISLDLAGTSASAQTFVVNSRQQDGKAPGEFSGIAVDSGGLITASYSNGDTVKLGRVALADFVNPVGLRQMGNSYWESTGISGAATWGSATENGYGTMMAGTIEGSNVDITEELVGLISAQRNFQANAKALETDNQISQTILNIR